MNGIQALLFKHSMGGNKPLNSRHLMSLRHYMGHWPDSILRRMTRNRVAINDENEQQTTLRLPESMHKEIVAIAKKNGRSANAEIVDRLRRSLSPTDSPEVVWIRDCFKEELAKALAAAQVKK